MLNMTVGPAIPSASVTPADDRDARAAPQAASGVAEVLDHAFQCRQTPLFAILLLDGFNAPELQDCGTTGCVG